MRIADGRAMKRIAIVVLVCGAHAAIAAPAERRCYAGTEIEHDGDTTDTDDIVLERVVDPTANQIAQRLWSSGDPRHDGATVAHVDPVKATFTISDVDGTGTGTGTLTGRAWHWNAYHSDIELAHGVRLMVDGSFDGDQLTMTGKATGTDLPRTMRLTAKAFDCGDLDKRRAALDHISASATHACYEGTSRITKGTFKLDEHVVLEQVVDAKTNTIEIRRRTPKNHRDALTRFKVDGHTIEVRMLGAQHGTGTIVGKPGAWTELDWTSHGHHEMKVRASLGGSRATETVETHDKSDVVTIAIDAAAFDCSKLAERQAALAQP